MRTLVCALLESRMTTGESAGGPHAVATVPPELRTMPNGVATSGDGTEGLPPPAAAEDGEEEVEQEGVAPLTVSTVDVNTEAFAGAGQVNDLANAPHSGAAKLPSDHEPSLAGSECDASSTGVGYRKREVHPQSPIPKPGGNAFESTAEKT